MPIAATTLTAIAVGNGEFDQGASIWKPRRAGGLLDAKRHSRPDRR